MVAYRGCADLPIIVGFNFSVPAAFVVKSKVIHSLSFFVPLRAEVAKVWLGNIRKKSPVSSALKISSNRYVAKIFCSLLRAAPRSFTGALAASPCKR